MRRPVIIMKLCFFAFLIALCGCSEIIAPGGVYGLKYGDYFWNPDSSTFRYAGDPAGFHSLRVGSGTIDDTTPSGTATGSYVLTGDSVRAIGPALGAILGLSANQVFISESGPAQRSYTVKAQAVVRVPGSESLLVATDSGMYTYNISRGLVWLAPSPVKHVDEMQAIRPDIVVLRSQGVLWVSSDGGNSWDTSLLGTLPGEVTAFAINDQDVYIGVRGQGVYELSYLSWNLIVPESQRVTALVALESPNMLAYGTDQGRVVELHAPGALDVTQLPSAPVVTALAADRNGLYAGTSNGLSTKRGGGAFVKSSTITSPVNKIVDHRNPSNNDVLYVCTDGGIYQAVGMMPLVLIAGLSPVSDLAENQDGLLALSGTSLWHKAPVGWDSVVQTFSVQGTWSPGALLMLKAGQTDWQAGTLLSAASGAPRAYSYSAHVIQHADELQLDSTRYHDVLIVQYASMTSDGTPNTADVPKWVIYFEKNLGPVRIERTFQTSTTVLSLVR